MATASDILLYLWQLPQNLLGALLVLVFKPERSYDYKGTRLHYASRMRGGISLGRHIILNDRYLTYDGKTEKHEWGHTRQSLLLGPLYLPFVGLPSLLWAAWWTPLRSVPYFRFFTERWADRLGGVRREP